MPGVVIIPDVLIGEIDGFNSSETVITPDNFGIGGRVGITLECHRLEDGWKGGSSINADLGTTKMGIGPTYTDRARRIGVNFAEFLNEDSFRRALDRNKEKSGRDFEIDRYLKMYAGYRNRLAPFLVDEADALDRYAGDIAIAEGAQGIMLDGENGSYPFVTPSSPVRLPVDASHRMGVVKAYTTRVGEGPMPTELGDPQQINTDRPDQRLTEEETRRALDGDELLMGRLLRLKGGEFGATTGRPRRCGWFDAALVRYAVKIGGIDNVVLTKLDVLSRIPKLQVCTKYELAGVPTGIPMDRFGWYGLEPVFEELPGWEGDIRSARMFGDLPKEGRGYVDFVEAAIGRHIDLISIGPKGEETIVRK